MRSTDSEAPNLAALPQAAGSNISNAVAVDVEVAAARTETPISEMVRTAPSVIWLQISDDDYHADEPFPQDHEGITWCQDSVLACQVRYVRADLADAAHLAAIPLSAGSNISNAVVVPVEVAAAIERLSHAHLFFAAPDIINDIRTVCAAASRAVPREDE